MGDEIHRQESDVVHHVDPAQFGFEFQTIERHQMPLPTEDIAGMQIAVAFSDESTLLAQPQGRQQVMQFIVSPVDDLPQFSKSLQRTQVRQETGQVAEDGVAQMIRTRPVRGGAWSSQVELREALGEINDFGCADLSSIEK